MNRLLPLILVITLLAPFANGESAVDYWPTWRGPEATGVAPKGNPPIIWSETENIKWKVKAPGDSSSSPIVWDNKIFMQTAIDTGKKGKLARDPDSKAPTNIFKFDILCLDRKTGKTIWQKTAREEVPHEGHHPDHGYASYSPVTDGEHVWLNFGSRGIHCYDVDGNHKWSVDVEKMKTPNTFGEGSSPVLAGNALIVVMDHEGDSYIIALNKDTGKTIWKESRDELTNWSTPLVVEVKGKLQVVVNATNVVTSYDAETGEFIWECAGQTQDACPTPVAGFGKVFCTSGYRGSTLQAIELGHTGDLTDTGAVVWEVNKATPYVPSPLLYGEKLYVCWGNKAIVSCYDANTGKPFFFKQKLEGMDEIYASPVGVANRIYFAGRDGKVQVIKKSDKIEVLATNTLDDRIDATPAIVGNEIILKGKTYIYCIAKSGK